MTLAVTGLAASAQVQGTTAPRVAPQAVYDVAPPLGTDTDEVLFGEVWRREGLGLRDRSLVTVSAPIANGRAAPRRGHIGRALDNGMGAAAGQLGAGDPAGRRCLVPDRNSALARCHADQHDAHVAIAEAQDGTSTPWMEHVTDEQYAQASRIQGGCRP